VSALLWAPLAFLAHVTLTFLLYGFVMAVSRAKLNNTLSPGIKFFSYPWYFIGLLLDFSLNVFWGTLVFLQPPRDVLLTGRLIRIKKTGQGWRLKLATWICEELLDPLDPKGCHCRTD
jgi:hypothetical protein